MIRDAGSQMSERLNFLTQRAEDKNGRGIKKRKNPRARSWMGKASSTKGCWSCFFKECQWQGVTFAVRFSLSSSLSSSSRRILSCIFFSSKNKLIHSLQFHINIVDLTCIYSSPPPPHTSFLIYSVSAGSIRVLLSQCTLSKLFYLFVYFFHTQKSQK